MAEFACQVGAIRGRTGEGARQSLAAGVVWGGVGVGVDLALPWSMNIT